MKFVALISGGKDSCFNILECLNQGHELVALANLHPPENGPDELDSFMFQSVGARAVVQLAECFKVPLFRQVITGNEDQEQLALVKVLQRAITSFPEIKGVSVGAIASTYQQLRVDRACYSLGLRSLAFMWQREPIELLDAIIASGLDARLIKVASYGLDRKMLNKSLAECREKLVDLHSKYGIHPCGEGGEYETFVFGGPRRLFKKRLGITSSSIEEPRPDDVASLNFQVEILDNNAEESMETGRPPLFESRFEGLQLNVMPTQVARASISPSIFVPRDFEIETRFSFGAAGEGKQVFDDLERKFSASKFTPEDTVFVLVLLKDMAQFESVNKAYKLLFEMPRPPARACIEVGLIQEQVVVVAFGGRPQIQDGFVYVQGLSYWAPANIGPYAQSRILDFDCFISGQIGLVPETLSVAEGVIEECVLGLQNSLRVAETQHALKKYWLALCVAFVTDTKLFGLVERLYNGLDQEKPPIVIVHVQGLPRSTKCEWLIRTIDVSALRCNDPDDENGYVCVPRAEKLEDSYTLYYGFNKLTISGRSSGDGLCVCGGPAFNIPSEAVTFNGRSYASVGIELYVP